MGQHPSRCSSCPVTADLARDDNVLRRWASFSDLDRSAESACDVCAVCRQYLANSWSTDALRRNPGEVILYGSKDRDGWTLESEAVDGVLGLPLVDLEQLKQDGDDRFDLKRQVNGQRDIFSQSAKWVDDCLSNHKGCRTLSRGARLQVPELPKRLLDLGDVQNLQVFNCTDRINAGKISPTNLKYCTLSYRWGDTPHSCILTKPLKGELVISLEFMPQTFQDAVKVTRRLGIRYLWIDALCIVQPKDGDDTEWLQEGSRMGTIYQNATCTIAATAAINAEQGFLEKTGSSVFTAEPVTIIKKTHSTTPGFSTKKLYIPVNVPSFYECVSKSALNSRGWVVQERALSTRIIHFTEHGVFWECGTIKAHNIYGVLQKRDDFPSCRSRETLLSVARTKRTQHVCPVEWFHFVKQYSYTNFTNPQDRLMALSSVAKAVQPYLGGHDYIAGLWTNDVVRGLAWKCYHPQQRATGDITPSWSWASATGGVELAVFSLRMYRYDLVKYVESSSIPVVATNPFGRLLKGSVTLRGTLAFEWLTKKPPPREYNEDLNIYWDDPVVVDTQKLWGVCSPKEPRSRRYTLLPIGQEKPPFFGKIHIGALILEPAGKAEVIGTGSEERLRSEFRRVGWVEYTYRTEDRNGDPRRWWTEREQEEIVLV
ncbi:hypothetical protein G7046_g5651 [Stylonectria norvegica]|nr:hypothetical protein G7046_g5651 [Stylonectria norvegica]